MIWTGIMLPAHFSMYVCVSIINWDVYLVLVLVNEQIEQCRSEKLNTRVAFWVMRFRALLILFLIWDIKPRAGIYLYACHRRTPHSFHFGQSSYERKKKQVTTIGWRQTSMAKKSSRSGKLQVDTYSRRMFCGFTQSMWITIDSAAVSAERQCEANVWNDSKKWGEDARKLHAIKHEHGAVPSEFLDGHPSYSSETREQCLKVTFMFWNIGTARLCIYNSDDMRRFGWRWKRACATISGCVETLPTRCLSMHTNVFRVQGILQKWGRFASTGIFLILNWSTLCNLREALWLPSECRALLNLWVPNHQLIWLTAGWWAHWICYFLMGVLQ